MVERSGRSGQNGRSTPGGSPGTEGGDLRATVRVLVYLAVASALALGLAPLPASSTESRPAPENRAGSNQRTEDDSRSPGRPGWMRAIDRLVGGRPMGVSVREGDQYLYRYQDVRRRTPASNEKLLLSMALLDRLGP